MTDSQPISANPARVTDALDQQALEWAVAAYNADVFSSDKDHTAHIVSTYLTAAIGAVGQAVAVKPLEWKPGGGDGKMSIRADAIGLRYYIYLNGDDGFWHAYTEGYQMENFGEHPTKELAQKAVQSGHERRILSALSQPHPADERVVEVRNYETFRTFAHEATKAITNLTGGGSEYFGKEVDGVFLADLPRCVERLRHRLDRAALSQKEGR